MNHIDFALGNQLLQHRAMLPLRDRTQRKAEGQVSQSWRQLLLDLMDYAMPATIGHDEYAVMEAWKCIFQKCERSFVCQ